MSRSRKRRNKGAGQPQGGRRGRGGHAAGPATKVGFWGDPSVLPTDRQPVRVTADAPAVVRSLGPPPLPGHETIAEHYFAAVYDRVATVAGALAAVSGLIEPEEPAERDA